MLTGARKWCQGDCRGRNGGRRLRPESVPAGKSFRVLRCEPDRFPMFMRLEECAGMEAAQAVSQISLAPIK